MDFLEFPDMTKEDRGALNPGRLKMTNQGVMFKNNKTGKVDQVQGTDIETISWQRLSSGWGLRIMMKTGIVFRFGGFQDTDHDKLAKFFTHNFQLDVKNKDMCLKGWNWGTAKFSGGMLSFDVERSTAFEIPLGNVSHCSTAKNEVTLEFHQNDDAAVSLMELRFHVPTDASQEVDAVQAFRENVMSKASIIQATGDAIATFKELQCLTPRGRYDIKIFMSFIQLHGKTFDYKIPLSTILRLFLLPHKDNRQMFFVLSLDPPIKQGQTRYHFLILVFAKEDEYTIELSLSEEDVKEKFDDKLQKEMSGPTFEVISRIMKALVQRKITVPGSFVGHYGTQAITCSYRAGNGLLYPLERGLIYVHKPPVHIRFEEIAAVNFARSGGSTRSFDFEVETKNGVVHTFSSIEKEEYGKLFDFASSRKLRIKNRGSFVSSKTKEKPNYNDDELVDSDVEDEPDAYLHRVKAEGRERDEEAGGGGSSDSSSDDSFNPGESGSEVAEEYDSNAPTSDSSDEEGEKKPKKIKLEGGSGGGSGSEEEKPKIKEKKKSRSAKTVKEPGMRKKRTKKPKDKNKPKRPASAYFMYLNDMREQIKTDNPGISFTDITKKAAEMWKEVKDKTKWEQMSADAKKVYDKAMEEYKANIGNAEKVNLDGSDDDDKKEKKVKEKKTKEPSKPKAKPAAAAKSPSKSPAKPSGAFKSKEYISSSGGSDSDSDEKPLKIKEEKSEADGEEEEEEEAILSTPTASEASSGSDDD